MSDATIRHFFEAEYEADDGHRFESGQA